jgi:hypothetical protein
MNTGLLIRDFSVAVSTAGSPFGRVWLVIAMTKPEGEM